MERKQLLTGAREALDEAIATVTQAKYSRLSEGRNRGEIQDRLDTARKSLELLWKRKQPDYHDEWVAILYAIRYQPRQVNLVHSVLLKSAPRIGGPVHVVDVGSGAWASMIALAIFHSAAKRSGRKTEITIHGIEPSTPMTRLGEDLWVEFGCAAERRGLVPIIETVDAMTATISIFPSLDDYSRAARARSLDQTATSRRESWLLSVHALYEESKNDIRDFLDDYREWNPKCIRYELITSDGGPKKRAMVRDLIIPESGQWHGPRPEYWEEYADPDALPVWTGVLPKTTDMRSRVLDDFKVRWDSHNDVRDDAIWVRSVLR